jgi:tetratricopeptide (TPR) repeat protein
MTAPIVTRLLRDIPACQDAIRRAELTAQLACYYARTGELDRAAALTIELRSSFGAGSYPRVSVLIMLIEALRYYFADQNPLALDRLRRACLISGVIRDRELVALTESWMSHLHFNKGDYLQFGQSLARAFEHLDNDNLAARCRLAISLADSFLLVADHRNSRAWYADARDAAVKLGDQAAIGAITYNRAALHVHVTRTLQALDADDEGDAQLALAEVESAINYQRIAGLTSLDHLLFIARASALIVQGRFDVAKEHIERLLADTDLALSSTERAMLGFDRALCAYQTGAPSALYDAFDSPDFLEACLALDPTDRLIIFGTLRKLNFDSIGSARQIVVQDALRSAAGDHSLERSRLVDAIRAYARI